LLELLQAATLGEKGALFWACALPIQAKNNVKIKKARSLANFQRLCSRKHTLNFSVYIKSA
jgi:hypothetical protein